MNSKLRTQALYDKLISLMDDACAQMESLGGKSHDFQLLQRAYQQALRTQADVVRQRMQETMEGTEWERLVIAFFGETNAGKSTIIDTFRVLFDEPERRKLLEESGGQPVDGTIIGDGSADFTRVYHEYQMTISGRPFTLIDVPGIEGNEDEQIREEIQLALKKAHVVFYVCSQKPDTATAAKISHYLSQWVNVYAIYNIRGGVSNYDEEEEREMLLTPQVKRNMELIDGGFQESLPQVYRGICPLQALLASCAVATFSAERKDLSRKQEKLISFFGGREALFGFSGFRSLESLVEEKSTNYLEEVDKANEQKINSLYEQSIGQMQQAMERNRQRMELLQLALKRFSIRAEQDYKDASRTLERDLNIALESLFDAYYDKACIAINAPFEFGVGKRRKALLERAEEQLIQHLREEVPGVISSNVSRLQDRLVKDSKELQELYASPDGLPVAQGQQLPDIKLSMKASLGILDLNKKDYRDFLLHVGGMASVGFNMGFMFPVIGNLAGTLIGALVGLVHDLSLRYKNQGSTRSKAKEHARKETVQAMQSYQAEYLTPLIQEANAWIDEQRTSLLQRIHQEEQDVQAMHNLLQDIQLKLQEPQTLSPTDEE